MYKGSLKNIIKRNTGKVNEALRKSRRNWVALKKGEEYNKTTLKKKEEKSMARYEKILPLVDSREKTFEKIYQLMISKGFKYETTDGESLFRKGDGVWVLARYLKITYSASAVRVEAWVDSMGTEMDLEGFVGSAGKKPLRKIVNQVEAILSAPAADYTPVAANQGPAFCAQCGTQLDFDGNCPSCADAAAVRALPEGITLKEYFKNYAGEKFNKNVRTAAIIGYVCVGINALISILMAPIGLVESAILLGLTLGMHLGKSKGCAIGMLVYSIFTVVLTLVMYGTFGGWLWIVAGGTAVAVFKGAEKRFKELTNK